MNPTTRDMIVLRVRRIVLEQLPLTSKFWSDNPNPVPDQVLDGYDQGCQMQLMTCIDNAEKTGRLEDHDNGFLQHFICLKEYTLARGQYEYFPLPGDLLRAIKFTVNGVRGIRVSPDQDRVIQQWPGHFGSAKGQVQWSIIALGIQSPPVVDDHTRVLRTYVYGDTTSAYGVEQVDVPNAGATGRLSYYRNVYPMALQSPPTYTDVPDPWNEGPCLWSAAVLQEKAQEQELAATLFARAKERFNSIIPPPRQQVQQ